MLVIILYFLVPESEEWKRQREQNETSNNISVETIRQIVTNHWKEFISALLLMTALNFVLHGMLKMMKIS